MSRTGVHENGRVGRYNVLSTAQLHGHWHLPRAFWEEGEYSVETEDFVHDSSDEAIEQFWEVGLEGPVTGWSIIKNPIEVHLHSFLELGMAGEKEDRVVERVGAGFISGYDEDEDVSEYRFGRYRWSAIESLTGANEGFCRSHEP